jgi:2,3-bisphosphoglycerate-dependent phosphoglycerate mutase
MGRDIYLVAHTQSQHHVEGRVGGWYDTGLTELGRRQAEAVAGRIAELAGDAPVELYASDLKRAAQTAEAIGRRLEVPVRLDADLREITYGDAGGRPEAWLEARRTFAPPDRDRMDHRGGIEGAETKREFGTRVYRAVERILASPARTQVVVTHGFAVTFFIAAWIRMPLEAAGWVNFKSGAGGISHLHEDDVYFNRYVMGLNAREHLEG